MPAMHLISVDLPAPLSPTSAITRPESARKSTFVSASTGPKLFDTPRSSRSGVSLVVIGFGGSREGGANARASLPRSQLLLAVLRVVAGADVAPLDVAVLDRLLPVLLRDHDRRLEGRRHHARAVAHLAVDAGRLAALDQRDRQLRGGRRLERDRLVRVLALPAGDDVLDALRGRVLAAHRDRLQVPGLERRDHRVRETVVRRVDGLDVVARRLEHLLEDRERLLVVPVGHPLVRALLERAVLVQRLQDRVVALLE